MRLLILLFIAINVFAADNDRGEWFCTAESSQVDLENHKVITCGTSFQKDEATARYDALTKAMQEFLAIQTMNSEVYGKKVNMTPGRTNCIFKQVKFHGKIWPGYECYRLVTWEWDT